MERLYYWCQKILPLVYDDSLSYYEILCKVCEYINKLIERDDELLKQININTEEINELKKEVELLAKEFNKIKNGEYVNLYIESLKYWIDKNLQLLVGNIVKYVFFTIDDQGYFNANIPYTWDFIEFETDYDSESKNYLHLILHY